jgi:G3E family GTPase
VHGRAITTVTEIGHHPSGWAMAGRSSMTKAGLASLLEFLFDPGGAERSRRVERRQGQRLHHDRPSFDTYTYEGEGPLPMRRITGVLSRLAKTVSRAKRLLNLIEKPAHPCVLQSTGRRATVTLGRPWGNRTPRTEIVFVGTHGGVDGAWLMEQWTVG